jgi:hypothetical protein
MLLEAMPYYFSRIAYSIDAGHTANELNIRWRSPAISGRPCRSRKRKRRNWGRRKSEQLEIFLVDLRNGEDRQDWRVRGC